jgi:hypothetical protein
MAVVVEVGEHVAALGTPLADPLGPPSEVIFGIRAGVEVLVVRAVEPDEGEARRRAEHARQVRDAGDAVGRASGSFSLRNWVRPRDAYPAMTNPSGSRSRVEHVHPVVVAPAGGPDVDGHGSA